MKNTHKKLSPQLRYVLAIAIFLFASALRLLVAPVEHGYPFITYYPAMIASFYFCGMWPGVLVSLISAFTGLLIFTPPFGKLGSNAGGYVSATSFLMMSAVVGYMLNQLRVYNEQLRSTIKALKQSEQRVLSVLEDQTEFICRLKADGTIVYVNQAFCQLFGQDQDSLVGRKWHPIAWQDDLPMILEKLATLTPENPIVTIENRIIANKGEVRWAQFVNHGFFNEDGSLFELQSVGRDITLQKQLETKLAASYQEIADLYDHAPCGYHSLDIEGKYQRINATELAWLGCSREDVIGKKTPADFFTKESEVLFKQKFLEFLELGVMENLGFDLVGQDGITRHVSLSATAIYDENHQFLMSRSVMYDISEIQEIQNALHQLMQEQQLMLDNDLVGMIKVRDRNIIWKNKAMDRIFGYGHGELDGVSTRALYPDAASWSSVGQSAYQILKADGLYNSQVELLRKNGEKIWVDIYGMLLSKESSESLWMISDITAIKKHEQEVSKIAYHDILTGLPNRLLIADRLKVAIAQAERAKQVLAVCYIDLDDFKPINDLHGHSAGDFVLKEVSSRMLQSTRASDTVGRLGGDEFVLLLVGKESLDDYLLVIKRVMTQINQKIMLEDETEVQLSASIGIALSPKDSNDPDTLLQYADRAMYQAKNSGRNRVCVYVSHDNVQFYL